jgi:hypothetical protein
MFFHAPTLVKMDMHFGQCGHFGQVSFLKRRDFLVMCSNFHWKWTYFNYQNMAMILLDGL